MNPTYRQTDSTRALVVVVVVALIIDTDCQISTNSYKLPRVGQALSVLDQQISYPILSYPTLTGLQ